MHVVAWGVLVFVVVPAHYALGSAVLGMGLGVTAYTLGVRHAFDADHIAAVDNTTRTLLAVGKRPVSVGFWFALGHSTVVVVLAMLIAFGAKLVSTLVDDGSGAHQTLGVVGTSVSGLFLFLVGTINLIALAGIVRVFRGMRRGCYDDAELEAKLNSRGFIARILGPLTRSIRHPWQMYPIGLLFGLGFDTATEIALLVLAGSTAASGLPWYAIMVLPLLFTAGMTLFDTLDGAFMSVAYRWAFSSPVRKVYYNITVTGLSAAVALIIGTIELVTILHDRLGLTDPVTGTITNVSLDNVGFLIVGTFVAVWAVAIGYWHLAKVEERWALDR
ncbi:HoxN/HupN/NixA family nickel/cobalt transporter [Rhodococcus spelaei]|uniref:Nickel/cobalt efflux system n=2 Tax=Rhodococcus spelaei TaxID=2546320 RepID=A0A541B9A3_9NOCA|nr:HoxN/HupN/NixA family nickel/cobalt transporter [Rhodococcus spelaei]